MTATYQIPLASQVKALQMMGLDTPDFEVEVARDAFAATIGRWLTSPDVSQAESAMVRSIQHEQNLLRQAEPDLENLRYHVEQILELLGRWHVAISD